MQGFSKYVSHYRQLLSLGIPIMIGQLGMIILSFADTMMVGNHSTMELGAASFVNNIMNLLLISGTGFSYGLTPVVGAHYGCGESRGAGGALRNALLTNGLVSLLMMALLTVVLFNVHRMGQPAELLPLVRPYYLVLLFSVPFVMLFNAFKMFADGITATRVSMWILLTGNALNILGNYVLIYGRCGLPEMGLLGAGVSTLCSRVFMVVLFSAVFLRGRRFAPYRGGFIHGGFSRHTVRRLFSLGTPISLQMGIETASFSLTVIMVGWLGTVALASNQVMLTVSQLTFMIYYGLGAAVAVRTSYFHGQRDRRGVGHTVTSGFHLMVMLELLLTGVVVMLRHHLGGWFTEDTRVSSAVVTLMVPFVIYQFGDGLQIVYSNALRGISDVRPLVPIALLSYIVVALPVSYCFGFVLGLGLLGVWLSFPFGLTLAGFLMWRRFRYRMSGS